jgi:hypothetical protein
MLFKKVIYISEGYFGTKAANSIQVTAMCNSFIKSGLNVELISRGENINEKQHLIHKNFKGRINFYRFLVLIEILFKGHENYKFIYGRSFIVQHILSVFGIKSILELHTDELSSIFKKFIFKISNSKNIKYVGISSVIFEDKIWSKRDKIVLHDGHDNYTGINFVNENKILKIGYFGKIAKRKGSAILKYLDQNKPNYVELNIYSSDLEHKNSFQSINEFKWLSRGEIYTKMKEMDVLLLPIKKVQNRDYSRYTSPLKLFEYASCGRVILYTPVDSLVELNLPIGFYPCINNQDWINKLDYIFNKKIYIKKSIQLEIHNWSKSYTWDSRVKTILDYAHS